MIVLSVGIRRGDVFALRSMDVDFERGFVRLRENMTKTGKARTVWLIELVRSASEKL